MIFDPSNSIFCNICEREITKLTKIFCENCKFFTCVRCIANGEEKFKHKRTHDYRVIDNLEYSLFCDDWTANEELLLFEGLYKRGYGNWSDIADMVGSKTKEECELHYMEVKYKFAQNVFSKEIFFCEKNKNFSFFVLVLAWEKRF